MGWGVWIGGRRHTEEPEVTSMLGLEQLELLELKDCHIHHCIHDTWHIGGAQYLVLE